VSIYILDMQLLVNISRSKCNDQIEILHYIYKSWSSNHERSNNDGDGDGGIVTMFRLCLLILNI
jgi:hypothetical protein